MTSLREDTANRDLKKTEKISLWRLIQIELSLVLFLSLLFFILSSAFPAIKYYLGIRPLQFGGLLGVLTGPWTHGDFSHWFGNLLSFSLAWISIRFFYRKISYRVLFWGGIATGASLWLIGRPSVHIGGSGIVYMLWSFLFFKAFTEQDKRALILPLIVMILFSGFFYGILPGEEHISWEGHLMGFLSGMMLSFIFRKHKSDSWKKSSSIEEIENEGNEQPDLKNHPNENISMSVGGLEVHIEYKESTAHGTGKVNYEE